MTGALAIEEFARRLGLAYVPGDQQRAIITSPADRPALVIAGAGAGKTETMSLRAAWLVASGVPAGEILGLTFTRKAAGELADRMQRFTDRVRGGSAPRDEFTADVELPIVSTYNAWAASVYREHALAIGREPDAEVIGEAAAWRLARRVVAEHGGSELIGLQRRAGQIASSVVALSNAITDNLADPADVLALATRFVGVLDALPAGGTGAYAEIDRHIEAVSALEVLVPLVEHYRAAKRRRGLIEFSDQVSAAVEICQARPEVAAELRERHRHVILDEYQDTSVVQTRLLASVFHGGDVMAVGDPNQSIYGWRGASAANLAEFAGAFGATTTPFVLAVSRRNPARVLDAANALSEPLREISPVVVPELEPKPDAPIGAFELRYTETVDDEAAAVADWMAERIGDERDAERPTAAIIFRARAHMARFQRALRERGVRSHILGGGGLLSAPEVTDLVACLRVLVDPEAGSELIRLLAGGRWRIGLRDLAALERIARWLAERDHAQQRLDDQVLARLRESAVPSESSSIVDALDFLVDLPRGHRVLAELTDDGAARLRSAGAELRRLRHKLGLPLPDLVRHVEEVMRLDIEVVANDARWGGLANLRAFRQQVEAFTRVDDEATLRSLLDWVDRVREDDREIALDDAPREPGVVQLITIHGAKGLEWDVVAIPRLVHDELPAEPAVGAGWVGHARLPSPLRGDARHVPQLDWEGSESRVDYLKRLDAYREALGDEHRAEYRRLIYVAITRTKRDLLLSGSWWGGQKKPRPPSIYLLELAERGLLDEALPEAPVGETDPRSEESEQQEWPRDPLGDRRDRVVEAAATVEAVRAAVAAGDADLETLIEPAAWAQDLRLLLAEHEAESVRPQVAIPERIPASGFKHWIVDADGVLERLRRPMPEQPRRENRIGTIFHTWVEHRFRTNMPESLLNGVRWEDGLEDGAPGLDAAASERLERCKANFLGTRWAGLRPLDVERAIELPFAGRVIPCKIDAVFEMDGRVEIVDWKTGRRPDAPEELAAFDYQLALYRVAWSKATGTPLADIDAKAYFAAVDEVYAPASLPDEPELLARWDQTVASAGDRGPAR